MFDILTYIKVPEIKSGSMIITKTNTWIENLLVVYKKQKNEIVGKTMIEMSIKIFIFVSIIAVSYCQTNNNNYSLNLHKRRPYHDYDPYYHHYHKLLCKYKYTSILSFM